VTVTGMRVEVRHRTSHAHVERFRDEDAVRAFHQTALAAGATDEGAPGPRPEYGEPYYGCFVRDLDGHKIEAAYWNLDLAQKLYGEKG
jgi:catechol 2,3-dioxygenase-like lactoylglutathione lyase family enzyme